MMKVLILLTVASVVIAAHGNIFESYGGNWLDIVQRNLSPPDDETYTFTEWETLGGCNKVCGGGVIMKQRRCMDSQGEYHNIAKCTGDTLRLLLSQALPTVSHLEQKVQEACNMHACNVSEWSDPSPCSRVCGVGYSYRSRTCYDAEDQSLCNFQGLSEASPCNPFDCFRVSEYDEWSDCSRKCGVGMQTRSRSCVPNFLPGTEIFEELKIVQNEIQNSIFGKAKHYKYTQNYEEICGQLEETQSCKIKDCPSCVGEHVWHDCKPCLKVCRKEEFNEQGFLVSVLDPFFTDSTNGCNDDCVPGCQCPIGSPYTDLNRKCYLSNLMCPGNLLGEEITLTSLLNLLANTGTDTRAIPQPQPNFPYIPPSSTTAETTTTTEKPKMICPYQVAVAHQDACVCKGNWQRLPCIGDDQSKCNWSCVSSGRGKTVGEDEYCPKDLIGPATRSGGASDCDELLQCTESSDCGVDGFICCASHCGKICVPKVSYEEP